MQGLIVAIDGPAGSGKSSVSRAVAARLGLPHLDTGGHYRAATLVALRAGIAPSDGDAIAAALDTVTIHSVGGHTMLGDEDVEAEIRGPAVTAAVSGVSAHPQVREKLVALQRAWAAQRGSGIVEGRDIGSVVFPDAPVKVYLTADESVRALRRAAQRGEDPTSHQAAIRRRDALDGGRAVAPMTVAEGAVILDTTEMTLDEVVDAVVDLVRSVQA